MARGENFCTQSFLYFSFYLLKCFICSAGVWSCSVCVPLSMRSQVFILVQWKQLIWTPDKLLDAEHMEMCSVWFVILSMPYEYYIYTHLYASVSHDLFFRSRCPCVSSSWWVWRRWSWPTQPEASTRNTKWETSWLSRTTSTCQGLLGSTRWLDPTMTGRWWTEE